MDAQMKDADGPRCPMGFGKHGRANRDWWPNNLSLQRLNQHAPRSNPLARISTMRRRSTHSIWRR